MILQERITGSGTDVQTEVLNYYYSPDGKLLEIGYKKGDEKENHYSVIRNALGDVTALYTAEGTLVGTYEYDPYGKLLAEVPNEAYDDTDGILEKNPFRYRGYYYDRETGWYYLQSRYYDPEVKRFINADSTDLLTNDCMNLMQYNLFMYCNGDPINNTDSNGHLTDGERIALMAATFITLAVVAIATGGTGLIMMGALAGCAAGGIAGATVSTANYVSNNGWNSGAVDAMADGLIVGGAIGTGVGVFYGTVPLSPMKTTSRFNGVGNPVSILGRGSTGRTEPYTINEQMSMHQVKSNPLDGAIKLPFEMKDPRWLSADGWVKMQNVVSNTDGKTVIHFVYNVITHEYDDFKLNDEYLD